MARVRIAADVDADLRRRVKVAAALSDLSVSEWIEEAVRRELDGQEEMILPPAGTKPRGSRNPARPRVGGNPVSEAVIEDRR